MSEYVEGAVALPPEPLLSGGPLHARLDALDVGACDQDTLVEMLADYERCTAHVGARQQQILARLDRLRGITRDDWTREEVAAALRIAPTTASDRLAVSRTVYHRLKDTWRLLHDGRITALHARALAHAVDELTDDETLRVQVYALGKPDLPIGEFTARIRYAVAKYAPRDTETTREQALRERTAWHKPGDCETGTLVLHGPLDATAIAWTLIDDHAHRNPPVGDGRTLDQRRFDAFTDLFLGQRAWQQIHPSVEVTVPLDALLGGNTPGELVGYGPIPADTARDLAFRDGSRWRRLVTDPATGALVACGAKTYGPGQLGQLLTDPVEQTPAVEFRYRPSTQLARHVRTRDRYCCFPGCRRKARRTELDHTIPWPVGATAVDNLHPLCKRHHRLKDENTGWSLANNPDGSASWTSPAGRKYTAWPHDYNGP